MATGGPGGPNLGISKGGGPTIRSFSIPVVGIGGGISVADIYTLRGPLYTNPRGPEYHVGLRSWLMSATALTIPVPPDLGKVFRGPLYTNPRGPEYSVQLRSWFGKVPPAIAALPFVQDDWPVPRAYLQPIDIRTITASYNPNLIGQDVLPTGERVYDLSVRPYEYHAQLRHWSWSYNLNLIGKDKLPTGEVIYDLTPRPYTQPSDIRTITESYNPNLVGQDVFPPGERYLDLARGYEHHIQLRTWTWQYNPNLIGQDAFPPGKDIFDRPPLSPVLLQTWISGVNLALTAPVAGAPFAEYDWPLTQAVVREANLSTWISQTKLLLAVPFSQSDWPVPKTPTPAARTFTASYNLNLIGQDALPVGEIRAELPTPLLYPISLRQWFGALPPVVTVAPFSQTDWPASREFRQLRSWTWQYNLNLIGQDKLPFSQSDWPTPKEYRQLRSWAWSYNLNLIGQDIVPGERLFDRPALPAALLQTWITNVSLALTAVAPANPFAKYDWPLTSGPQQPDRAYVAFYNLNLIGQDLLPFRQDKWPLTPATIREANLSTWIDRAKFILTVPFSQSDWPVPRPQPPAARTWTWSYNLSLIGQDKLPNGEVVTDLPPRAPAPPTPIFVASYNKNLIGQDQLPTGAKITDLSPQPPLSAIQLRTWIQQTNIALNAFVPPQPFNQFDWPINFGPRQPIQVFTASFNKNLIGQDKLPIRQQFWPVPTPFARQPDLATWLDRVKLLLTPTLRQTDWPVPRGPQQPALSYTASYNQNLIGQDRLPNRQQDWPLPRDQRRLSDWIRGTNPNLFPPTVVVSFTYRGILYGRAPIAPQYPVSNRSWFSRIPPPVAPIVPLPKNQYSWPLPAQFPVAALRYSFEFQGGSIYYPFNPIPPPPDPTPPEDVRLIYNAGNEWQMLDRIREPGPVGWR